MGLEAVNRDILRLVPELNLVKLGTACQHAVGAAVLRSERQQHAAGAAEDKVHVLEGGRRIHRGRHVGGRVARPATSRSFCTSSCTSGSATATNWPGTGAPYSNSAEETPESSLGTARRPNSTQGK